MAYHERPNHICGGQAHRAKADRMQTLTVLKELTNRTNAEKIAEIKAREAIEEEDARWHELYSDDGRPFEQEAFLQEECASKTA